MELGYKKQSFLSFEATLEKVRQELARAGFGVISEIDVAETFRQKLGRAWDKYTILGACHAPSAFEVLKTDPELGLFLPCNVIVWQSGRRVFVSTVRPTRALAVASKPDLLPLAREIEKKLTAAIDAV